MRLKYVVRVLLLVSLLSPHAARAQGWSAGNVTVSATLANVHTDSDSGGGSGVSSDGALSSAYSQKSTAGTTAANQKYKFKRSYFKNDAPVGCSILISFQWNAYSNAMAGANQSARGHAEANAVMVTDGFSVTGSSGQAVSTTEVPGGSTGGQNKQSEATADINVDKDIEIQLDAYSTATSSVAGANGQGQAYSDAEFSTPDGD